MASEELSYGRSADSDDTNSLSDREETAGVDVNYPEFFKSPWSKGRRAFLCLEAYAKFQLARGCSRKTVLHYLDPIRIADRWTGKNETSCGNRIWLDFRLPPKLGKALRYGDKKRRAYLPISSLVEILDWLPGHKFETSLIPGVGLQGLCGLQLQEVLRLTWDRVDLQSETITIEEDRRHDPSVSGVKNEHRVRKLPLPKLVVQILADL
jgi:integrase